MPNFRDHAPAKDLERYSLGRLADGRAIKLEEHLLVCEKCRKALDRIEPFNFIHGTDDGPFYARVTCLGTGYFFARHWSRTLQGGKEYRSRQGARNYLLRTFAQMFPEHVCSANCGSVKLPRGPSKKRVPGR